MVKLSLAMICRNEEKTLARVLNAAKQFCDEMIVVDTGSTDLTMAIARDCGAKVEEFVWIDDFAAARNYSFNKCTGDWILWLDADDELSARTIEAGKAIKAQLLGSIKEDIITCPYNYIINEEGVPILTQGRERFIRRSVGPAWYGRVHETIMPPGAAWGSCADFVVDHKPLPEKIEGKKTRNIDIFKQYLDIETCSVHELFLFAGEYLMQKDYDAAAKVFYKYLDRYPKDKRDVFDEKYTALMKLAETERQRKDAVKALEACALAIAYDCTRGEAYGQMGVIHFECGNFAMAKAAFLACRTTQRPTKPGIVVFDTFYHPKVLESIEECDKLLNQEKP